ncbi:MAG: T9SS type A sorting domain-containing protein [Bacteroidales bacterium]|nr:MAG: T9SS type A sorting domain-containing protein [Bacteroidales bacterium]
MLRKIIVFTILIDLVALSFSSAQQYTFGWEGEDIIQQDKFLDAGSWIPNQSELPGGDSCFITTDSVLNLHWRFGKGARHKWLQAFILFSEPLDLGEMDFIGIDIRGSDCSYKINRHIELKFEDGTNYATYIWDNLAQIYRWCERLTLARKQFTNSEIFNWENIKVISFAVVMNPNDLADTLEDSGIVSFRNLIAVNADSLERAEYFESLDEIDNLTLDTIKANAAAAIMKRQASTGLLRTWKEDNSSWLYGHGLALKILTEEGIWEDSMPVNDFAVAAENLAHFLAEKQEEMGFWPRAWNANTGNYIVYVEDDNTVWMGDFPWIPGGLAAYYKKSGDNMVIASINKARSFLYDLIDDNGRVNTINVYTLAKTEVNNYEGYAATIYCLYELGDTITAKKAMHRLLITGWESDLKYWKEGPGSRRPVLLVNTWLSSLFEKAGYSDMALESLSLAGKVLFTKGPGEPPGLDGVGPVATWYEGTLSYISARGPGSNYLFSELADFINSDGTVPAYNDSLGAMAGVWAVNWSSLDATSWLYYAAAGKSPFDTTESVYALPTFMHKVHSVSQDDNIVIYASQDKIYIIPNSNIYKGEIKIELYSLSGAMTGSASINPAQHAIDIDEISYNKRLKSGVYIIRLYYNNIIYTQKLVLTSN